MNIPFLERELAASPPGYHNRPASGFFSRGGLLFVIAAHAAVFAFLLQARVITLPEPLAVLSVSLLPPQVTPAPPKPEIVPPKPRPVERRPQPTPQPVQLAAPEVSPAPSPVAAVPPAPTFAPPAPVQIVQPRFDADYVDNPKPPYPPLSRRLGEQGRVVLRVHVLASGSASDVQLHTSSGSPRLDQSALETVRRWKFVPARSGGEAVAAWVLVPIAFTLKE